MRSTRLDAMLIDLIEFNRLKDFHFFASIRPYRTDCLSLYSQSSAQSPLQEPRAQMEIVHFIVKSFLAIQYGGHHSRDPNWNRIAHFLIASRVFFSFAENTDTVVVDSRTRSMAETFPGAVQGTYRTLRRR